MHAQFPSWWTMISVDLFLLALVIITTTIVFRLRESIARAGAVSGIGSVLVGMWIATAVYLGDLFTMIVLPGFIGHAEAMGWMGWIHNQFSWYTNSVAAIFVFGGLILTIKQLTKQLALSEQAKSQAEEHSRQKSAFLSSMSHELRTPLNAILGYSQMIQLKPFAEDQKRVSTYARSIEVSGQHLRDLVDDLLDLSRIEAGRLNLTKEMLGLGPVISDAIESISDLAEQSNLTVEFECEGNVSPCFADPRAVQQIVTNLVSNAIKHSHEGGQITVRLAQADPAHVIFTCSDKGSGIAPELLKTVFEPFVHSNPLTTGQHQSHGLGLHICKELVEAHKGEIQIESQVGSGTKVIVKLLVAGNCHETEERESGMKTDSSEPSIHDYGLSLDSKNI